MRGSTAGVYYPPRWANTSYYTVLVILDYLFSSVIVVPAVVGYWRSVWELLEIYIYPQDLLISAIISTTVGAAGHMVVSLIQNQLQNHFDPDRGRIRFYVSSRFYTYLFAFICVNGWRGPWQLMDMYSNGIDAVWTTTIASIVALALIRTLRNIGGSPFAIIIDQPQTYFEVVTMFRISPKEKTSLYILDCLFSVLVVGTLVVFVWRGAFLVLDVYLFPENAIWSAWGSLILGYGVVVMGFLLQPLMKWLCDRLEGISRLIVADIFLLFSFLGTVNVWRGIWNLLNLYFLPDNLELSCWICHWFCFILLVLLKCSNTLLVRGVYIDAEEPAGKCVVFPVYYLRLIFQHEKVKKLNKKFELEDMARRKLDLEGIICIESNSINNKEKDFDKDTANHCQEPL